MENLIEIKISYSAILSWGTSRVLFSSLESVVLNGWTRILQQDNLCKMFRYNEDSAESSILVWLREYMGQLSSSRRYLLDLLLALAWWYRSCSTFSGLPFDCTNHGREDRHFSRPYDLSTFVLTSFVQTEIVQFLLFRLHILTATALQWINDRDAPYRVLLHLSCEIIADCLVFDGWAQIYYFTVALFVSYLHHHSFSYFGSQYRCAKPSLYICFEFSEWCYYVTTFGFQNHILGLWHGDESWFWHWGHVINMTSSYAMWRWCQYTSEAGYL